MNHLSGLDAAFLYVETPETPMHVGGLNIFELPPGYEGEILDNLRTHIAQRMHLAPVFQRKLVNMPFELANPIWVADEDLDLEYHIRSTVLPKPGNRAQLDKLVGRLHSSLLDRSRPLWEFYVIEGIETPVDAPPATRHVAFYSKVHHAAVDGEAGVALAHAIMDLSATPRAVRPAPPAPHVDGCRHLRHCRTDHRRPQKQRGANHQTGQNPAHPGTVGLPDAAPRQGRNRRRQHLRGIP